MADTTTADAWRQLAAKFRLIDKPYAKWGGLYRWKAKYSFFGDGSQGWHVYHTDLTPQAIAFALGNGDPHASPKMHLREYIGAAQRLLGNPSGGPTSTVEDDWCAALVHATRDIPNLDSYLKAVPLDPTQAPDPAEVEAINAAAPITHITNLCEASAVFCEWHALGHELAPIKAASYAMLFATEAPTRPPVHGTPERVAPLVADDVANGGVADWKTWRQIAQAFHAYQQNQQEPLRDNWTAPTVATLYAPPDFTQVVGTEPVPAWRYYIPDHDGHRSGIRLIARDAVAALGRVTSDDALDAWLDVLYAAALADASYRDLVDHWRTGSGSDGERADGVVARYEATTLVVNDVCAASARFCERLAEAAAQRAARQDGRTQQVSAAPRPPQLAAVEPPAADGSRGTVTATRQQVDRVLAELTTRLGFEVQRADIYAAARCDDSAFRKFQREGLPTTSPTRVRLLALLTTEQHEIEAAARKRVERARTL